MTNRGNRKWVIETGNESPKPEMSHQNRKWVIRTGNDSSKLEISHRNQKWVTEPGISYLRIPEKYGAFGDWSNKCWVWARTSWASWRLTAFRDFGRLRVRMAALFWVRFDWTYFEVIFWWVNFVRRSISSGSVKIKKMIEWTW